MKFLFSNMFKVSTLPPHYVKEEQVFNESFSRFEFQDFNDYTEIGKVYIVLKSLLNLFPNLLRRIIRMNTFCTTCMWQVHWLGIYTKKEELWTMQLSLLLLKQIVFVLRTRFVSSCRKRYLQWDSCHKKAKTFLQK